MTELVNAGTRVQVATRICPPRPGDKIAVHCDPDDKRAVFLDTEAGPAAKSFVFDHVFTDGQEEVYEKLGVPMLKEVFEGFNVCLFAYGQTGSGKTHSLFGDLGDTEANGIAPRFARAMMEEAQVRVEADIGATIKFSMSMVEIYMEKVRDLLVPRVRGQEPESLDIHEDSQHRVFVKGASVHSVLTLERMLELLKMGNLNRQTGETKMNETSSRSHAIIQITISQKYDSLEKRDVECVASLVDLAGSERQSRTESTGVAFEEAKKINLSLLMLGRALNAFSERKGGDAYISLRASKLTRLLSESLGGNSKTWMLATVSPASVNLTETISTLEYAQNAMAITNKAKVNRAEKNLEYEELKKLSAVLQMRLDNDLAACSALDAENAALRDEIDLLKKDLLLSSGGTVEEELQKAFSEYEILRRRQLSNLVNNRVCNGGQIPPLVCFSGTCKTHPTSRTFETYEVRTLVVPYYSLGGPPPLLVCHICLQITRSNCVNVQVQLQELQHLPDSATGGVQVTIWFDGNPMSTVQTPIVNSNNGNPQFSLKQIYMLGPLTEDLRVYLQSDVLCFKVEGIISEYDAHAA